GFLGRSLTRNHTPHHVVNQREQTRHRFHLLQTTNHKLTQTPVPKSRIDPLRRLSTTTINLLGLFGSHPHSPRTHTHLVALASHVRILTLGTRLLHRSVHQHTIPMQTRDILQLRKTTVGHHPLGATTKSLLHLLNHRP